MNTNISDPNITYNNKAYFISFVGFILSSALIIYYAQLVQGERFVSEWLAHQFFFNYQDLGFIRRGLPGSILHYFPSLLTIDGIKTISILIALTATGIFWIYFFTASKKLSTKQQLFTLLIAVSSPATFMHIGYDMGRYDWIGLTFFILSIFAIEKKHTIYAIVFSSIGVLSHEAYFLIFFPSVIAFFLLHNNSKSIYDIPWLKTLAIGLPVFGLYILLSIKGNTGFENGEAIRQHLTIYNNAFKNIALTWGYDDPFDVLIRDFRENWNLVIEYFGREGIIPKKYLLITFIWTTFFIAAFFSILKANRVPVRIWHFAACTPILLTVIAVDYARFSALTFITTLIMYLYIVKHVENPIKIPLFAGLLLVSSCLLGPIGEIWIFPHTITPGF